MNQYKLVFLGDNTQQYKLAVLLFLQYLYKIYALLLYLNFKLFLKFWNKINSNVNNISLSFGYI